MSDYERGVYDFLHGVSTDECSTEVVDYDSWLEGWEDAYSLYEIGVL